MPCSGLIKEAPAPTALNEDSLTRWPCELPLDGRAGEQRALLEEIRYEAEHRPPACRRDFERGAARAAICRKS